MIDYSVLTCLTCLILCRVSGLSSLPDNTSNEEPHAVLIKEVEDRELVFVICGIIKRGSYRLHSFGSHDVTLAVFN